MKIDYSKLKPGDTITYVLQNNAIRFLKFKNKDHRDRYIFYVCDDNFKPTGNILELSNPTDLVSVV